MWHKLHSVKSVNYVVKIAELLLYWQYDQIKFTSFNCVTCAGEQSEYLQPIFEDYSQYLMMFLKMTHINDFFKRGIKVMTVTDPNLI